MELVCEMWHFCIELIILAFIFMCTFCSPNHRVDFMFKKASLQYADPFKNKFIWDIVFLDFMNVEAFIIV